MPLEKRSALFDESMKAAKAAQPAAPSPAPPTPPTPRKVLSKAEQEEEARQEELRDQEYAQWQFAKERYGDVADAVELHPKLAGDPDIQVALSTIRNAQRAIEARAEELLGG